MIRTSIIRFLNKFFPKILIYIRTKKSLHNGEFGLRIIPFFCNKKNISVDIGSNLGTYAYEMSNYSKFCYAFEPNPFLAKILDRSLSDNVKIFQVALSNKKGNATLKIPISKNIEEHGLASIEDDNTLNNRSIKEYIVKKNELDNYQLEKVDFIKIDVEGHELSVLEGCKKLINKYRPVFLVEIEERHKSNNIEKVNQYFNKFMYQGFYNFKGKIYNIDNFEKNKFQNIDNINVSNRLKDNLYINNFIFIGTSEASEKLLELKSILK